jgi:probable HAF family extracellular repeat protein
MVPISSLPLSARPYAINDSGQLAGSYYDANQNQRSFFYSDGNMIDLGTFGGAHSAASAVNAGGDTVGCAEDAQYHFRAFLYSAGVMKDLSAELGSPVKAVRLLSTTTVS